MGFLGSLIGGGLGFLAGGPAGALTGASIGGGFDANQAARDNADSANQFSAQQYATRWQTTTKDMQAAGLNPMLAYSQGVGNSPSGNQAPVVNPWQGSAQSYAQASQNDSQIALNNASAAQAASQSSLIDRTVDKVSSEIRNLDAQAANYAANTSLTQGNTQFDAQQRIVQNVAAKVSAEATTAQIDMSRRSEFMERTIQKLVNETELGKLDVSAARKMGNLGRDMGQLKPFFDILVDILRASRGR